MSDAPSKLQRLQAAGILEQREFTAEEMTLIETITDDEITVLVRLRERLGSPGADQQHIRPNVFI